MKDWLLPLAGMQLGVTNYDPNEKPGAGAKGAGVGNPFEETTDAERKEQRSPPRQASWLAKA